MVTQGPPTKKIIDVYDEEFITNLELAKNLMGMLHNPKDVTICKKWLTKLCTLKANDVTVKRNRNSFFKYFLQVLNIGVSDMRNIDVHMDKDFKMDEARDFMCRWSPDKRTYVAAKPLPGEGTLVYMAVSKDPSLGWEQNGDTTYI